MRASKEIIILLVSLLLTSVAFLFSAWVKPAYLSAYNIDPLDLLHVLFPFISIISALFALLLVASVYFRVKNSLVHLSLLFQFSLILWYTPAFMSNYIYGLDTLDNSELIPFVPSILRGQTNIFTTYVQNYPASFVFNYGFLKAIGLDVLSFSRTIEPIYWIFAFILFSYVIVRKIFKNPEIAFISTALLILGLAKLEYYPTPSATGILLVLSIVFVILFYPGNNIMKAASFLPIIMLVLTHPESPILLLTFLLAPIVILLLSSKLHLSKPRVSYSFFFFLSIFVAWLGWASLSGETAFGWEPIASSVQRLLTLNFLSNAGQTTTAFSFIYPVLSDIRTYSLYSFGLVALLIIFSNVKISKSLKSTLSSLYKKLSSGQVLAIVASFLFVIMIVVFGTIVNSTIRQRAEIYLVLSLSAFIASGICVVVDRHAASLNFTKRVARRIFLVFILAWVILLAFLFPVSSYYDMAYCTSPKAEETGFNFIGTYFYPSGQSIWTDRPGDLALPLFNKADFTSYYFPVETTNSSSMQSILENNVGVVIYRQSIYYAYSMQSDFSFTNNSMTRMMNATNTSPFFARVYSNPSFQIYVNPTYEPNATGRVTP